MLGGEDTTKINVNYLINKIYLIIKQILITLLFKQFFFIWTILKASIEFVTTLLLLYILVFWPQGRWDFSFSTRDQTHSLCIGR